MNLEELRDLFDIQQRRDVLFPDTRREVTPLTIRQVALTGDVDSMVIWSRLDESTVEAAIHQELAHFRTLRQGFEWKVYEHDRPADLGRRLEQRGFVLEDEGAIMVLDEAHAHPALDRPVELDIRRLTKPEQVADLRAVLEAVWNSEFERLARSLAKVVAGTPEYLSLFLGYADGRPVSCAWTFYNANPDPARRGLFASLWGGSTLAEYRGRGFYTALLAARLQEARRRGLRFLTVDAGEMSRPILEKYGFVRISTAYAWEWAAGAGS